MADIQTVIDALQDAKVNELGHIWITDEARCAMVRILMKHQKEQQTKIRMFVDSHGDIHPLNKEEIICCKDCEHYSNGICFVSNDPRYRRSDFYCGDARKREE